MIEALKKLIVKHGGTYDRYDNTELELFRRLCDALKLPYDKYMDVSQLFNLVAEKGIVSGGNDSSGESEEKTSWESVIPNKLSRNTATYTFVASNGIDMYYSYSSSSDTKGIWHRNLETGIETKIHNVGYAWQYFFEDSKGNVYVSSGSGNNSGILYINGTIVTKIHNVGYYWNIFFEDSKGNVYVSTPSDYGLIHLNGTVATQISSVFRSVYFFENSKGNVYIGSSVTAGVYYLDGLNLTQLYNSSSCTYFFESNSGDTYVKCSTGIIYLDGATAKSIYPSGSSWAFFYEDSKGNVYVSGSVSSSTGILYLNGDTATKIYETGYYWQYFFEDSKGNIYVGGPNSSYNIGIIHIINGAAKQIYETGYYWQYFYEDSKGNVYVGGSYGSKGLLHLSADIATQIYSNNNGWKNFNIINGELFVSTYSVPTHNNPILHVDGTTVTLYYYMEVK